ncbi:unnamed protein product, partial [Citrullus colocynthis]
MPTVDAHTCTPTATLCAPQHPHSCALRTVLHPDWDTTMQRMPPTPACPMQQTMPRCTPLCKNYCSRPSFVAHASNNHP